MSDHGDRKWRPTEGELTGFVPLGDWPTVKECREFNRRADAWLRKRGEKVRVDEFKFGKETDGADTD